VNPTRHRSFPVACAARALLLVPVENVAMIAQPDAGAVEGRVTFAGTPPAATMLTQDGDSQPVLYLDRSGGLRYAVVYLPDGPRSTTPEPPPASLNQRHFIFEPQVLAVRAGQAVRFTNDDPANHNVRAQDSRSGNTFSINTASGAPGPFEHRFAPTPQGEALGLSCDIHPWMAAWVYVFEHDRFAVTAENGSFLIQNVPAGRHRVVVRQPAGRLARDLTLDVRAGETARLDVRFTASDIGAPGRRR
jgi:plastocyanin